MRNYLFNLFAVLTMALMPWSAFAESQDNVTLTLNNGSIYKGRVNKQSYRDGSIEFFYNYADVFVASSQVTTIINDPTPAMLNDLSQEKRDLIEIDGCKLGTITYNRDSRKIVGAYLKPTKSKSTIEYVHIVDEGYGHDWFDSSDIKSIQYPSRDEKSNIGVVDEIILANGEVISGQIVFRRGNSYDIKLEQGKVEEQQVDENSVTRIRPLNPIIPLEKQVPYLDCINLIEQEKNASFLKLEGIIVEKGNDYLILRTKEQGNKRIEYVDIDFVEKKSNQQYENDIDSQIASNCLKVGGVTTGWCEFDMKENYISLNNGIQAVRAKLISGDKLRVEMKKKVKDKPLLIYPFGYKEIDEKKVSYKQFIINMRMPISEQETFKFKNWRLEFPITNKDTDYLLFDLENKRVCWIKLNE